MQNLIKNFLEELGYALDETNLAVMFDQLTQNEQKVIKAELLRYLIEYLPIKEK